MKKSRILAVVMSVLMMISMLPVTVFAAEEPATELSGELKIKGAAALDVTLSADYTKVKPEGLTDEDVTFLWERKVSESDKDPLVELSKEKTYKVTAEDIGYKIVLTVTGIEEKGVTGELKVTSKEVTETIPEEELAEEENQEIISEEVQEEIPAEETEEQIPEEEVLEQDQFEEISEEVQEEIPSDSDVNEAVIEEILVNEEVYNADAEEEELTQTVEPGTEDTENAEEELMPLGESIPEESLTYSAEVYTADGSGILDFGIAASDAVGDVEYQTVTVKNTGTGTLHFESISPEHFMVQDITEPLESDGEISLWIVPREGIAAGTYQDTITYTSEEGAEVSFQAVLTVQEQEDTASEENVSEADPIEESLIIENISEELNMEEEPDIDGQAEEPVSDPDNSGENTEPDDTGNGDGEETEVSVSVSPDLLDFGTVTEGYETAPEAQTVVITNTGSTEITLVQPVSENDYYVIDALSQATLAPGENAEFTIQPTIGLGANSYSDVLSIVSDKDEALGDVTVSFKVTQAENHLLTITPDSLDFGIVEEGYETAPKAQTVTVTNAGNVKETLGQPVSDRFEISELSSYELEPGASCTFTVQPKLNLTDSFTEEISVPNDAGTSVSFFASIAVAAKKDTPVKLVEIQKPGDISGLDNGTEKTAEAFGLPSTVVIKTSSGEMKAKVAWDVKGCSYDPASTAAQTFSVKGTVSLPEGVTNPDNISLVTAVKVTVNAYEASVVSAEDNQITGITPNGQYTTKSTISFTAVGAGMDNKSPRKGDIRYLPFSWSVINTNTWTSAPYAASFGMGRSGEYTLTVTFNRQKYDGSNWVNTGEQDIRKVAFSVVQAADPTVTPTPGANQRSAVQTGDDTPILPLVVILIAAVICIAGILVYRKKKK